MKKKKAKNRRSARKVTPKKSAQKKSSRKKKVAKKKTLKKKSPKKKVAKVKAVRRRQPTEQELKQLGKEKRRAENYAMDKHNTADLLKAAVEKARRYKEILKEVWPDLMALIRFIRAWIKGESPNVPLQIIILAIATIIYLVNPFDAIPDFIPVVGLGDDAGVIAFVVRSIHGNLEKFLE